jgi:hypothetical protein
MAKIVDPDQLNQATEVIVSPGAKTIQFLVAGNLDDAAPGRTSGVTGQAGYSFLKEEWRTDTALNKFSFPLKAFTKFEFQWINGWAPADVQTRNLIRDAGWSETVGVENGDLWACIISLGSFDNPAVDQSYYQQVTGFAQTTANFDKTGDLNEAILINDASGSDFTTFLKVFLREQGKSYAESSLLVDQALAVLEPTVYRMPIENAVDTNITATDVSIDDSPPWNLMSIEYLNGANFDDWSPVAYVVNDVVFDGVGASRWYRCISPHTGVTSRVTNSPGGWELYPGERDIGGTYYAFNRIINGNSGTAEQVYEWAQRQLRSPGDINDNSPVADAFGVVNGNIAIQLLGFQGTTLQTNPGVYIDSLDANDVNRTQFFDVTINSGGLDTDFVPVVSTARVFPFTSVFEFVFPANAVADTGGQYSVYFTDDNAGANAGNDFDTTGAIIVNTNGASPLLNLSITGTNISHDYDYDNNFQRGSPSDGTDVPITVQVTGLEGIETQAFTFTITRATGLSFGINTTDERNYANP